MDSDWTGLPWAPRSGALALREHWIVEAITRDKYYLYGKLELHIDTQTFQGAWNRKFSWKGTLANTLQVMSHLPAGIETDDGRTVYLPGSNMAFQCAESIQHNRATVAGLKSNPRAGFDGRIRFDPSLFDMNSLTRHGK